MSYELIVFNSWISGEITTDQAIDEIGVANFEWEYTQRYWDYQDRDWKLEDKRKQGYPKGDFNPVSTNIKALYGGIVGLGLVGTVALIAYSGSSRTKAKIRKKRK